MLSSRNAILGVGRLNLFRLNYLQRAIVLRRMAIVQVSVDGQLVRVRVRSLSIRDVINDAPNTCTCTVLTEPTVGGRLRVYSGTTPQYLLFSGQIQQAKRTYLGTPSVHAWDVEAIDDTARGDWLRPFGDFTGTRQSGAGDIATWLVYHYTPGPMTSIVQPNLPIVSAFFDGTARINEALRELAKLIGGYFYWDDQALHFFTTPEAGTTPDAITGAKGGWLLDDPHISVATDDSQIRTRVYGRGHAEVTISAIDANDSRVPIADAVMFNPGGGKAIIGAQRLDYTGTAIGGTGALIGPGVTPSAAPTVAFGSGSGVTTGAHSYAYTWVTAAGETAPSPLATITVQGGLIGAPPPPTVAYSFFEGASNSPPGMPYGTSLRFRISVSDNVSKGPPSNPSNTIISHGYPVQMSFTLTADFIGRNVYWERSDNNGPWTVVNSFWFQSNGLVGDVPFSPQSQVGWWETYYDAMQQPGDGSQINMPGNLSYPTSVALDGIAVGASQVTARKVYRSAAGTTSPLKLLTTIADNTTTTYTDTKADAALGATAPASDTSGLQMPAGQVVVGATSLPVSSLVWADPAGGWAIVGNGDVIVRYTGVSGNRLTGIPASGNGSIVAPINYNSTITGAPMLVGVTWTPPPGYAAAPVLQGTDVAIWVQRDDTDAQTALAQRWGTGIVENVIVDGRRGEISLAALCVADLAMYSRPILTVSYTTLDPKTKSGRPVRVTLPDLGIDQTVTIQDVTIDGFDGLTPPRFTVVAGSMNITLEAILRRLVGTVEAF